MYNSTQNMNHGIKTGMRRFSLVSLATCLGLACSTSGYASIFSSVVDCVFGPVPCVVHAIHPPSASHDYTDEANAINARIQDFVTAGDQMWMTTNQFNDVWTYIDFYAGDIESIATWVPTQPPPGTLDENAQSLKDLTDESVLVEATLSKLQELRPLIDAKLRESETLSDAFPALKPFHEKGSAKIKKELDDLIAVFTKRKKGVDDNLATWSQWQLEIMAQSIVQLRTSILDSLEVDKLIHEVDQTFRALLVEFNGDIILTGNFEDAQDILDGYTCYGLRFPCFSPTNSPLKRKWTT
jgi:hypothetical protein